MPVYEENGKELAHSNAILTLIGRRHGLLPKDDWEAARHEGMLSYVEELRGAVGPSMRMQGEEKQKAREIVSQMNEALTKQGKIVGDYLTRSDEQQKALELL